MYRQAAEPGTVCVRPFAGDVCQPRPEQIGGGLRPPVHLCGGGGEKAAGKPLWSFIRDVEFPGSLRHYCHHRCPLNCPVCLENKFVPGPQSASGGRFPNQLLHAILAAQSGPCGWEFLHASRCYQAHLNLTPEGPSDLGDPFHSHLPSLCLFYWGRWRRRNSRAIPFSFC